MQDSFFKVVLILLACFVTWKFYEQSERIKYLEETIYIQNEAIERQNLLIQYQKYYFNFIERNRTQHYNPIMNPKYHQPL